MTYNTENVFNVLHFWTIHQFCFEGKHLKRDGYPIFGNTSFHFCLLRKNYWYGNGHTHTHTPSFTLVFCHRGVEWRIWEREREMKDWKRWETAAAGDDEVDEQKGGRGRWWRDRREGGGLTEDERGETGMGEVCEREDDDIGEIEDRRWLMKIQKWWNDMKTDRLRSLCLRKKWKYVQWVMKMGIIDI